MRTKVKKYILWASNKMVFDRLGHSYFRTRDEKGMPFVWRYQNALVFLQKNV